MNLKDRFISYAKIETTAGNGNDITVSNEKILDLTDLLLTQLQELSPDKISVNQYGIINAKFYGDDKKDMVAFLAHMDTSPQASGKDVKPRLIEKFDGKDIKLNNKLTISTSEFTYLKNAIGHDIIVTDGNTLLGADDKAGIAIIMDCLTKILKDKNHRSIEVIFTTDEEIGYDASHVSLNDVESKYGYTIDGGDYKDLEVESFNAYSMQVDVVGKSIHPGSAKDKLVNASTILMNFNNALPLYLRPEDTTNKQPFYHLCSISGSEENCHGDYIIRSFDSEQIDQMISLAKFTAYRMNEKLGYNAITLTFKQQYRNMKVVLDDHPEIIEEVTKVYKDNGVDYHFSPIRGGTTGSQLSFMGLPCPNLGTGGYNYHGRYEYLDLYEMKVMSKIVFDLMK